MKMNKNEDIKNKYEKELKKEFDKLIIKELDKLKEIINNDEVVIKTDYLFNISKIIDNYSVLEPTLKKFFSNKAREDKQKHLESWDSISK